MLSNNNDGVHTSIVWCYYLFMEQVAWFWQVRENQQSARKTSTGIIHLI